MRQSGVPSSRIRLYADICSTPSAKAASRLSCQSRSVWPGRPDIRSTLRLRMPAARAIATASSVWAKVWMRPMALSNLSCAACIPSDRRFSPQAQAASSHRGDKVPGFPSAVISASGRTSKRRRSSSRTPPQLCGGYQRGRTAAQKHGTHPDARVFFGGEANLFFERRAIRRNGSVIRGGGTEVAVKTFSFTKRKMEI